MPAEGWEDYLSSIYFNPKHPASFSGPSKLHYIVKREGKFDIGLHHIKKWLANQDAYSLQRPLRYKFKRNRVVSSGLDSRWDIDLADVSNIASDNDGVKYLLIAINVFTRFLWVEPLKNKTPDAVIKALRKIFSRASLPNIIRSDKGREFNNKNVRSFLVRKGITYYVTQNETKASYAERVIRTLKTTMYRYFTYEQTYHYLHILQDLVRDYNHRPHRSLNERAPADINQNNESVVWREQYIDPLIKQVKPKSEKMNKSRRKAFKFNIGDQVRLSHLRHVFQRDYQEKWTEEVFIISRRYYRDGIPVYKVKDMAEDPITGTFYANELQKVYKTADTKWRVEEVLKKRKRAGRKEVYVKWMGYPKKFNSWIPEQDLQSV